MARPTNRKRHELSSAVQMLRERLGQTQQEFAGSMGIALASVARYETSRPPSGQALLNLEQTARQNGHLDLAAVFRRGIDAENTPKEDRDTLLWAGVTRNVAWNRKTLRQWPQISSLLIDALEELVKRAKAGQPINGPCPHPALNAAYLQTWLEDVQCSRAGSASELVKQLVDERMSATGEIRAQALDAVLRAHPRIEARYRIEEGERITTDVVARLAKKAAKDPQGVNRRKRATKEK